MARAREGSLVAFFLLTYVVTWAAWIAAWALSGGHESTRYPGPGFPTLLFYVGVFAPGLIAVALTARHEGQSGVRTLLARLIQWRAGIRWYVFALTYMAVIKLTAALIHRLATGEWPRFGDEPLYIMVAAILATMVVFGQAGEELGWRGYALPRLASRFGLGGASVIIGITWASWHLPLFFIPGIETTGQSFTVYLLGVVALSVAITWLYAHTNGSLFLTMLMHSAINNTKDIVPNVAREPGNPFAVSASLTGWLSAGLLWICAAYFLIRMRTNPHDASPPSTPRM
jgi:membrane protease YdiL (CAAX protease family)